MRAEPKSIATEKSLILDFSAQSECLDTTEHLVLFGASSEVS